MRTAETTGKICDHREEASMFRVSTMMLVFGISAALEAPSFAQVSVDPNGAATLMNPPILNDPINGSERGEFEQHSGEAFDQWPQAGLWHHWYEVVEHGTLTKQGVGTLF